MDSTSQYVPNDKKKQWDNLTEEQRLTTVIEVLLTNNARKLLTEKTRRLSL